MKIARGCLSRREACSNLLSSCSVRVSQTVLRVLIVGTSLVTYSACRLGKRASQLGLLIGILNKSGVKGEGAFF